MTREESPPRQRGFLEVLVRVLPGGSRAKLDLRGGIAGPTRFRESWCRIHNRTVLRSLIEGKESLEPLEDRIRLDLPEADLDRWDVSALVTIGRPALLGAEPDGAGGMRALVALVAAGR